MKTLEIRPCRFDAHLDIEECRREQAGFWGVYERYDHGDGQFLADWVADFMTESEAVKWVVGQTLGETAWNTTPTKLTSAMSTAVTPWTPTTSQGFAATATAPVRAGMKAATVRPVKAKERYENI